MGGGGGGGFFSSLRWLFIKLRPRQKRRVRRRLVGSRLRVQNPVCCWSVSAATETHPSTIQRHTMAPHGCAEPSSDNLLLVYVTHSPNSVPFGHISSFLYIFVAIFDFVHSFSNNTQWYLHVYRLYIQSDIFFFN